MTFNLDPTHLSTLQPTRLTLLIVSGRPVHRRWALVAWLLALLWLFSLPAQVVARSPTEAATPIVQSFRANGQVIGFGPDKVYLAAAPHLLTATFVEAAPVNPEAVAGAETGDGGATSSLGTVTYPDLWPGISLVYEGTPTGLAKSSYNVAPGADPTQIRLRYNLPIELRADGSLQFSPTWGQQGVFQESAPVAWQEINGQRIPVEVSFHLLDPPQPTRQTFPISQSLISQSPKPFPTLPTPSILPHPSTLPNFQPSIHPTKIQNRKSKIQNPTVSFRLGRYNPAYPLVIDPTYQWHTFYGGSGDDSVYALSLDSSGSIYLAGYSSSGWNGPLNTKPLNAYAGNYDMVVVKLDSSGDYQWHTFYGGSGNDYGHALSLDSSGNIYLAGEDTSGWNGPDNAEPLNAYTEGLNDMVVVKLDSSGIYQWHTFYGGSDYDGVNALSLDSSGNIYLAGYSSSPWNGPLNTKPLNAYTDGFNEMAVVKLNSSGDYQWHTFYGGSGDDISWTLNLDSNGNIYLAGYSGSGWNGPDSAGPLNDHTGGYDDIVVVKLNSSGDYQWHTFYGGSGYDDDYALSLDSSGNIYLGGTNGSGWNGPAGEKPLNDHTGGYDDIVVIKLDSSGDYQWHTFYGGSGGDVGRSLRLDSSGNIYLSGDSLVGWNGPNDATPLNAHTDTGYNDMVVVKLDSSGIYQWHTFYGGNDYDEGFALSLDSSDNIYLGGFSWSAWNGPDDTTPLNPYTGSIDMVVVKIGTEGYPEMEVWGDGADIADGDNSPSAADWTDFGQALLTGSIVERTFTISNTGAADLDLTGAPKVEVNGLNPADFTVTAQPGSQVSAGGTTTFTVRFDPSALGLRQAMLSIANNDDNENPYDFAIQGTGLETPATFVYLPLVLK